MRFTVDAWDPDFDAALQLDPEEESTVEVRVDVEADPDDWQARTPPPAPPSPVIFVDGVRRVEARIWIEDGEGSAVPGVCGSYAAGAVRCDEKARIQQLETGRGVFSPAPTVADVETRVGAFRTGTALGTRPESLWLALHERMTEAEVRITEEVCREAEGVLVVVDGPLRGRQHLSRVVGYTKTHRVRYLPEPLHRLVGGLGPGQRTPVFLVGTTWSRYSWYLRLPSPRSGPWTGVVRCELSSNLAPTEAIELADDASTHLPRFASAPHKEPRAPQNLYPIAGLERELRRRLGDARLIHRALQAAAGGAEPDR